MSKITIDFDPVTKVGAVYYGDVQLCDIPLDGWIADTIDEQVTEHITKGIEHHKEQNQCQRDSS